MLFRRTLLRLTLLVASGLLAFSTTAQTTAQTSAPVIEKLPGSAPVTIASDGRYYTLSNSIVTARINLRTGDLEGLIYKGVDRAGHDQGAVGPWEQNPSATASVGGLTQSVTIDPASNGGARGEVSIKGVTGGKVALGASPGSNNGTPNLDLEIRYAMGRGESGVYTYAIFSHPAAYPAGSLGAESRFILRVNQSFDWISVDKDRNMLAVGPQNWGTGVVVNAKEQRIMSEGPYKNSVEHKYSYNAIQYKIPAYGWSSTQEHVGVWFINPTIEYLSGGASKQELVCHYGDNDNPDPIILNYWKGSHYGGTGTLTAAAGEEWSKVVGPIFVYVNSLSSFKTPSKADLDTLAATAGNPSLPAAWTENQTALWQDALAQAKKEKDSWPYDWVQGVDYPHKNQRGSVTGQIVLNDPLAPTPITMLPNLTIGLAHPDGTGGTRDWLHDAKYYQFWNDGSPDGKFTITNARPGTYTLHAWADGVLGNFSQADITVVAGKTVDLGKIQWKPVRYGKQLWEIGYPNRNASELFKGDGDNYWLWGWSLRYPLLFPNDLTYTVGQNDFHKDWFFEQVPHAENLSFVNPAARDPANQRFGWVKAESRTEYPNTANGPGPWRIYGRGRATTWTIKFNLDRAPQGSAAFRVALAGADGAARVPVTVNGQSAGAVGEGPAGSINSAITSTNALRYNTDKGIWQERTLTFDAALLKRGENVLTLTVPAGDVNSGVVYDYLRLELNEASKVDGRPIPPPAPAN